MKSGDPKPNDDLKVVIAEKQSGPSRTVEIVSEASGWLKAALKGADIPFNYACCEEERYGFAVFTVIRFYRGVPSTLDIKIAEIHDRPYVFADVRALGRFDGNLFPFFGDLQDDDHRALLLHFIADFILSTNSQG